METRAIYTDRGLVAVPMGTDKQAGVVNDDGLVLVSFGPHCFEARNGSRHARAIDLAASGLGNGTITIAPGQSPRWFDAAGCRASLGAKEG